MPIPIFEDEGIVLIQIGVGIASDCDIELI